MEKLFKLSGLLMLGNGNEWVLLGLVAIVGVSRGQLRWPPEA